MGLFWKMMDAAAKNAEKQLDRGDWGKDLSPQEKYEKEMKTRQRLDQYNYARNQMENDKNNDDY